MTTSGSNAANNVDGRNAYFGGNDIAQEVGKSKSPGHWIITPITSLGQLLLHGWHPNGICPVAAQ